MLALVAIALAAAAPQGASVSAAACPAAVPFPRGFKVIEAVRVVRAVNGESAFVPVTIPATLHAYFRPGEMFGAIDLKKAKRVQIVSGPPNVDLPYHASPGYEMFLTIQGGSTVILPNGQRRDQRPGSLVIMEDMGSKTGHAGRTGPCGYVSVQIVPEEPLKLQ